MYSTAVIIRLKLSMAKASSLFCSSSHSPFSFSISLYPQVGSNGRQNESSSLIYVCSHAYIYLTLNVIESTARHKSTHKSSSFHCDAESLNLHISLTKPFCFVLSQMLKWKLFCLFSHAIRNKIMLKRCLSEVELVESALLEII